jgi:hypothetical protein
MQPFRRGFEAVGYAYKFIGRQEGRDNEKHFREQIMASIRDRARPVIARGVVGPPAECIIVGFDDDGEVLLGWSFFQAFPEFSTGVEFEPSGYFRKRGWFDDTEGLFIIGEGTGPPPKAEVHLGALRWALDIVRTPVILGDRHNGLAAYTAWCEALARDEDFSGADMDQLRVRYHVHEDAVGTVAEGRWYAARFLKQVIEAEPSSSKALDMAVKCYETEHDLMWKIWGFVGGPQRSDEGARKLAEPAARREIIALIREAREQDKLAADQIEKALGAMR